MWWSSRWACYAIVLGVSVPMLFSWKSLWDLLWASITFTAGVVFGHYAARLRKKYLGWLPIHGGWVALFSVLALGLVFWSARPTIIQAFSQTRAWLIGAFADIRTGDGLRGLDFSETLPTFLLLVALIGWLSDRYGPRALVLPGLVGLALGFFVAAGMNGELWMFFLAYGCMAILVRVWRCSPQHFPYGLAKNHAGKIVQWNIQRTQFP